MLTRLLIILFLNFGLGAEILRAETVPVMSQRTIRMQPGQMRSVSFPSESNLHVSRRGIVDIAHAGQGWWHLTALRSGIVMITTDTSQQSGSADGDRLLVEVTSAVSDEVRSVALNDERIVLPTWLCREPGVQCQNEARVVAGQVKSVDWFRRALTFCRLRSECRLSVVLDTDAMASWERETRTLLGRGYVVNILGKNLLSVMSYCGDPSIRRISEAEVEAVTQGGISDGVIIFRCLDDVNDDLYQLQMRMYSVQEAEAHALGLEAKVNGDIAVPTRLPQVALLAKLEALAKERRVETVAEPIVRIAGNQAIEFTTGSEFQVLNTHVSESKLPASTPMTVWKHLGLRVKAKITALSQERVRISYDLSYRDRSGRDKDVSLSEVRSDLICGLGTPTMASILDLRGKGGDKVFVPILAKLPLIGALFSRSTNESLNTRLVLWFVVQADDKQDKLKSIDF